MKVKEQVSQVAVNLIQEFLHLPLLGPIKIRLKPQPTPGNPLLKSILLYNSSQYFQRFLF